MNRSAAFQFGSRSTWEPSIQRSPQFSIATISGLNAFPFGVNSRAIRFDPSLTGTCWITSAWHSRSSRSLRMFVGIRSGEATNSLRRPRPGIRSRTTNNVHLSPNKNQGSTIQDRGNAGEDRRSERVFLEVGRRARLDSSTQNTFKLKATGSYTSRL